MTHFSEHASLRRRGDLLELVEGRVWRNVGFIRDVQGIGRLFQSG